MKKLDLANKIIGLLIIGLNMFPFLPMTIMLLNKKIERGDITKAFFLPLLICTHLTLVTGILGLLRENRALRSIFYFIMIPIDAFIFFSFFFAPIPVIIANLILLIIFARILLNRINYKTGLLIVNSILLFLLIYLVCIYLSYK